MKRWLLALFLVVLLFLSIAIPVYASVSDNGDTIVYITETGSKYHLESCSYLRRSQREITLREAVECGYTACSLCNPPHFNGTIEKQTEPPKTSTSMSGGTPVVKTTMENSTSKVSSSKASKHKEGVFASFDIMNWISFGFICFVLLVLIYLKISILVLDWKTKREKNEQKN